MIKLYTGTPGSGKSLHIAERIYYTLRAGRPVIGNFSIDLEKVHKKKKDKLKYTEVDNLDLTPTFLINYSRKYFGDRKIKEDEILLVIDEAQIIFNARDWQRTNSKKDENGIGWLQFYSQHRKYGFEVVLVAQFDGMIDRQIRSLVEYEYKHRKLSNFGLAGKIMSFIFFGKVFCAVAYWYPIGERLGADWFIAKRKIYEIYDTYKDYGVSKVLQLDEKKE